MIGREMWMEGKEEKGDDQATPRIWQEAAAAAVGKGLRD